MSRGAARPSPRRDRPYVVEIKGNSLDDGPGIRSVVFLKGCPLDCRWCHNPETKAPTPELVADAAATGWDGFRVAGHDWDVAEIVARLQPYAPFYEASGGGVTLSGGEPTLYMTFAGQLSRALHERGMPPLLETCGHFALDRYLRELDPWLDRVYFDLKLIDERAHRHHCGRTNRLILANFRALARRAAAGGTPVLARVPLIPGITATAANLQAVAAYLRNCGVDEVALLPYNPLWPQKARQLGRAPAPLPTKLMSPAELARCREPFAGFTVHGLPAATQSAQA